MDYHAIATFRKRFYAYHVFQLASFESEVDNLYARVKHQSGGVACLPVFELNPGLRAHTSRNPIRMFAAPLPLIEGTARITVELRNRQTPQPFATLSFTGGTLKWQSRLHYRLHASQASLIEPLEQAWPSHAPHMKPLGVFPLNPATLIYRMQVNLLKNKEDAVWQFKAIIDGANPETPLVLRDTTDNQGTRTVILSLRVPQESVNVTFWAYANQEDALGCAIGVTHKERTAMLHRFFTLTEDAKLDSRYPQWFRDHRATLNDLEQQRATTHAFQPRISIVCPLYQPPLAYLQEAVGSVLAQSYTNWELVLVNSGTLSSDAEDYLNALNDERIAVVPLGENRGIAGNTNAGIERSTGDYIAFLDQDDWLEPDALFCYVEELNAHPETDLLYCDEDSFTTSDTAPFNPLLKPDFNRDLLYSHNYIVHLLMVSKYALALVGTSPDESSGAQDYDLTLRISEVARRIAHIPRVLYHWREHEASSNAGNTEAKPYAIQAGIRALKQHFERRGLMAEVTTTSEAYVYNSRFTLNTNPLISIIIPNKDYLNYLIPCIESIVHNAGNARYEIIVVENNSTQEETFTWYKTAPQVYPTVRVITYDQEFNYSKIINFAAEHARGDYFLFLNNDTEICTAHFLERMVGYFARKEVGVVGPLLLFPDGLIQQAGLALMASGRLGFLNQNHSLVMNKGYLGNSSCPCNFSAVLGACQMVPKKIFQEVGGYNEDLAVTYNDVDFCWRVRQAGYDITCTPHVNVVHREFGSRGSDTANTQRALQTEKEAGLMRQLWPEYFAFGDPCINPNCDKDSPYFRLECSSQ